MKLNEHITLFARLAACMPETLDCLKLFNAFYEEHGTETGNVVDTTTGARTTFAEFLRAIEIETAEVKRDFYEKAKRPPQVEQEHIQPLHSDRSPDKTSQ